MRALRQLRHEVCAGAIRGEVRPRLRDVRLLQSLHRLFRTGPNALTTAAENQLCPTAAIKRTFVEDPYYEYTIDEKLCIGCAKCVEGCNRFGNGSLFLQIRHDRCVHCNECAIARTCPGDAFRRVPSNQPYLLKTTHAH